MSLRAIAERDLGKIMESKCSFRIPVVITDPSGLQSPEVVYDEFGKITNAPLFSIAGDISELIDPDTGQSVSSRYVTAAIRTTSLSAAGFGYPTGTTNTNSKPWTLSFDDVTGVTHLFKVVEGNPDRTLGIVNLVLEIYKA